jgi:hypothetical protein
MMADAKELIVGAVQNQDDFAAWYTHLTPEEKRAFWDALRPGRAAVWHADGDVQIVRVPEGE